MVSKVLSALTLGEGAVTVHEVGDTAPAILHFKQRQGLGISDWLVNCYVDQAGLKHPEIHLPLPSVLGFKVCAVIPRGNLYMSLVGTLRRGTGGLRDDG